MKKIVFAVLFVVSVFSFAFAADQVTLTTYYPAPFGMYQEMRVMGKLGVGTTNPTSSLTVDDGSGAYSATGLNPLGLFMTGTNRKPALSAVSGNATGFSTPNAGNVALYAYGTDYSGYFGTGKAYFGDNVGVKTTAPVYSLQVGVPTGSVPVSTNGIAMAIKNDLWVDGKVYSQGGGEWTREDPSGFLYPTNLGDKVAVGLAGASYARFTVLGGGYFGIRAINSDRFSVIAGHSTVDKIFTPPAGIRGGVYIDVDNSYYGIYQANGAGNYFKGAIGIGTAIPRAKLDVNPSIVAAEIAPTPVRVYNLLSVGNSGILSTSATAKIYGTMLVSDAASFGGTIKAYQNVQLVPNSSTTCGDAQVGSLAYSTPLGSTNVSLRMCSPCYNDPVKCPGWTGGNTWVTIQNWRAFSGGGPGPGTGEITLPSSTL